MIFKNIQYFFIYCKMICKINKKEYNVTVYLCMYFLWYCYMEKSGKKYYFVSHDLQCKF